MKVYRFLIPILLTSTSPSALFAAPAYSPVVGFLRFNCPANSDTRVSVPFHPTPRWAGKLSGAPSDQGSGVVRLSLVGSPAFATGELTTSPHFLLCREAAGPEGRHFPIVAHASGTVDITATMADVNGLVVDGLVSVIPAWTLDSLFPPASQATFHPSTGRLASTRGSELLFFDSETEGAGLAPSRRFYVTAAGWFETGTFAPAGKAVIAPGQAFLVRHPGGVAATTFVPMNQVYGAAVTLPVRVSQGKEQDTVLALPRPVPLTLVALDPGAAFQDSASNDGGDRKDELLVFDNMAIGRNKTPSAIYFRVGGQWRQDTVGFPVSNAVSIEPSAGILLRKAAGVADLTVLWKNAPSYNVTAP